MDMNALMGTLLSGDALKNIASTTGTSQTDVKKVLGSALPSLLAGAQGQAKDSASGFAGALTQHAKADTTNLGSFLSNVDLADGAKIVGHLLGNETDATTRKAAQASGLSSDKTGAILSAAAPLLMSLLGQQTAAETPAIAAPSNTGSLLGGLVGSLLSNVNVGSLLMNLLGSGDNAESAEATTTTAKKKKTSTTTGKKKTSTTTTTAKKKTTTTTAKKKPASTSAGKKK